MAVQKKSLIGNRTTVKKAIIAKAGSKAELAPTITAPSKPAPHRIAPSKTSTLKAAPLKINTLRVAPSKMV